MGWPGIYSIYFSHLDGDKDSLLLDGGITDFLLSLINLTAIRKENPPSNKRESLSPSN